MYPNIVPEKVEGKLPTEQSFHKFPMKKSELLQKWKAALCSIDRFPITNWEGAAICELHFKNNTTCVRIPIYSKGDTRRRMRLKPEAFSNCSI